MSETASTPRPKSTVKTSVLMRDITNAAKKLLSDQERFGWLSGQPESFIRNTPGFQQALGQWALTKIDWDALLGRIVEQ